MQSDKSIATNNTQFTSTVSQNFQCSESVTQNSQHSLNENSSGCLIEKAEVEYKKIDSQSWNTMVEAVQYLNDWKKKQTEKLLKRNQASTTLPKRCLSDFSATVHTPFTADACTDKSYSPIQNLNTDTDSDADSLSHNTLHAENVQKNLVNINMEHQISEEEICLSETEPPISPQSYNWQKQLTHRIGDQNFPRHLDDAHFLHQNASGLQYSRYPYQNFSYAPCHHESHEQYACANPILESGHCRGTQHCHHCESRSMNWCGEIGMPNSRRKELMNNVYLSKHNLPLSHSSTSYNGQDFNNCVSHCVSCGTVKKIGKLLSPLTSTRTNITSGSTEASSTMDSGTCRSSHFDESYDAPAAGHPNSNCLAHSCNYDAPQHRFPCSPHVEKHSNCNSRCQQCNMPPYYTNTQMEYMPHCYNQSAEPCHTCAHCMLGQGNNLDSSLNGNLSYPCNRQNLSAEPVYYQPPYYQHHHVPCSCRMCNFQNESCCAQGHSQRNEILGDYQDPIEDGTEGDIILQKRSVTYGNQCHVPEVSEVHNIPFSACKSYQVPYNYRQVDKNQNPAYFNCGDNMHCQSLHCYDDETQDHGRSGRIHLNKIKQEMRNVKNSYAISKSFNPQYAYNNRNCMSVKKDTILHSNDCCTPSSNSNRHTALYQNPSQNNVAFNDSVLEHPDEKSSCGSFDDPESCEIAVQSPNNIMLPKVQNLTSSSKNDAYFSKTTPNPGANVSGTPPTVLNAVINQENTSPPISVCRATMSHSSFTTYTSDTSRVDLRPSKTNEFLASPRNTFVMHRNNNRPVLSHSISYQTSVLDSDSSKMKHIAKAVPQVRSNFAHCQLPKGNVMLPTNGVYNSAVEFGKSNQQSQNVSQPPKLLPTLPKVQQNVKSDHFVESQRKAFLPPISVNATTSVPPSSFATYRKSDTENIERVQYVAMPAPLINSNFGKVIQSKAVLRPMNSTYADDKNFRSQPFGLVQNSKYQEKQSLSQMYPHYVHYQNQMKQNEMSNLQPLNEFRSIIKLNPIKIKKENQVVTRLKEENYRSGAGPSTHPCNVPINSHQIRRSRRLEVNHNKSVCKPHGYA